VPGSSDPELDLSPLKQCIDLECPPSTPNNTTRPSQNAINEPIREAKTWLNRHYQAHSVRVEYLLKGEKEFTKRHDAAGEKLKNARADREADHKEFKTKLDKTEARLREEECLVREKDRQVKYLEGELASWLEREPGLDFDSNISHSILLRDLITKTQVAIARQAGLLIGPHDRDLSHTWRRAVSAQGDSVAWRCAGAHRNTANSLLHVAARGLFNDQGVSTSC